MKNVFMAALMSISLYSANVMADELLTAGNFICIDKSGGSTLRENLSISYHEGLMTIDAEQIRVHISNECKVVNFKEITAECKSGLIPGNKVSISRTEGNEDTKAITTISFQQSGKNIIAKATTQGLGKDVRNINDTLELVCSSK